jgi:hypothetical protein
VLVARALPEKPSSSPAESTASDGPAATAERAAPDEPAHVKHSEPIPQVVFGGPTTSAWREEALTRAEELTGLANWIEKECDQTLRTRQLVGTVRRQIERAAKTAANEDRQGTWARLKGLTSGSSVERTMGSLDAAEADLLRFATADYVCGQMPSLQSQVNRYLPKDDPRRIRLEKIVEKSEKEPLSDVERGVVVSTYHAANSQRRREILRLRSFRNVIVVTAVVLTMIAVGVGVIGSLNPELIPLCFTPVQSKVVCPTGEQAVTATGSTSGDGATAAGTSTAANSTTDAALDAEIRETASPGDIWLIEFVGMVAAALAAAYALRGVRGTSTPYSLPVALAALKLPSGALTAVLGLLLMRGGFIPGLSDLDTSAQIVSWAVVFGYSQQLFTRMVDQQAQSVLEDVGGRGAAGTREPKHA